MSTRDRIVEHLESTVGQGQGTPTIQEMADALDVAYNTIRHHLRILEADGVIRRRDANIRTIELVE